MANIEEKQIAKDILIELLKEDHISHSEHPDCKTVIETVCAAYKEILKTISSNE